MSVGDYVRFMFRDFYPDSRAEQEFVRTWPHHRYAVTDPEAAEAPYVLAAGLVLDLQAELPLKRIWAMVTEESE